MKPDYPSDESYRAAAWVLGCEVAAIRAVGEVEAGSQGAFMEDGHPVILFEPHWFDQLTKGKFRGKRVPGTAGDSGVISRPEWKPGSYGPPSLQPKRMEAAAAYDREAALKSASWGLFQILGVNHKRAGYATVQDLVNAAFRSADDHLRMLVFFVHSDPKLVKALIARDWPTFARIYNGPGYRKNLYDEKLAAAYAVFSRR